MTGPLMLSFSIYMHFTEEPKPKIVTLIKIKICLLKITILMLTWFRHNETSVSVGEVNFG